MDDTTIIETLTDKFATQSGRHIYGALGSYRALKRFSQRLQEAKLPAPLSITRGILDSIPDEQFRNLVEREAQLPLIVRQEVGRAFERFVGRHLVQGRKVVMEGLELLFAYEVDLAPLRTRAHDDTLRHEPASGVHRDPSRAQLSPHILLFSLKVSGCLSGFLSTFLSAPPA